MAILATIKQPKLKTLNFELYLHMWSSIWWYLQRSIYKYDRFWFKAFKSDCKFQRLWYLLITLPIKIMG